MNPIDIYSYLGVEFGKPMVLIGIAKERFLMHHGVKGQKWGVKNGPPYPINRTTVASESTGLTTPTLTEKSKQTDKPSWSKSEESEPFDYYSMQGDKTGYPRHINPSGFSSKETLEDHYNDHGTRMGFGSKEEYEKAGIEFFNSPRGKNGDAYVKQNGDACRYDYDSGDFVVVSKSGTMKTYWNVIEEKGKEKAEEYWRRQKNE